MKRTLKLEPDVAEWISEDPDRVFIAHQVLRNWMNSELRRGSKQNPESQAVVERANKRVEESVNKPFNRKELARSLREDIAVMNTRM